MPMFMCLYVSSTFAIHLLTLFVFVIARLVKNCMLVMFVYTWDWVRTPSFRLWSSINVTRGFVLFSFAFPCPFLNSLWLSFDWTWSLDLFYFSCLCPSYFKRLIKVCLETCYKQLNQLYLRIQLCQRISLVWFGCWFWLRLELNSF